MEEEMTIDLKEMFEIIKKKRKFIATITAAAVIISFLFSFFIIPKTYEAETTIIVGKEQAATNDQQSSINYNDVMMYQQLIKTYVEIAKSRTVAEKAAAKLGGSVTAQKLMDATTVEAQANTQIMDITVSDKTADGAMNKVNALSKAFIEESQRLYPSGNVQIMDKAVLPKSPVKPRKKLDIAIAFLLGLMVSIGIIFVREYMNSTIKTEQDVEKYLDLPVIGIIPKQLEE